MLKRYKIKGNNKLSYTDLLILINNKKINKFNKNK